MVVEQVHKLWGYNEWAWDHVLKSMEKISETEFKRTRPFFWGSLHGLLAHGLAAELTWHARLIGMSPARLKGEADWPTLEMISAEWVQVRADWKEVMDQLTPESLGEVRHYSNSRGEQFSLSVIDMIQHVVNHGTEHRSQMTPILYELAAPTPALDYLYFCLQGGS